MDVFILTLILVIVVIVFIGFIVFHVYWFTEEQKDDLMLGAVGTMYKTDDDILRGFFARLQGVLREAQRLSCKTALKDIINADIEYIQNLEDGSNELDCKRLLNEIRERSKQIYENSQYANVSREDLSAVVDAWIEFNTFFAKQVCMNDIINKERYKSMMLKLLGALCNIN